MGGRKTRRRGEGGSVLYCTVQGKERKVKRRRVGSRLEKKRGGGIVKVVVLGGLKCLR